MLAQYGSQILKFCHLFHLFPIHLNHTLSNTFPIYSIRPIELHHFTPLSFKYHHLTFSNIYLQPSTFTHPTKLIHNSLQFFLTFSQQHCIICKQTCYQSPSNPLPVQFCPYTSKPSFHFSHHPIHIYIKQPRRHYAPLSHPHVYSPM